MERTLCSDNFVGKSAVFSPTILAQFPTSIILDVKHEKIIRNDQGFFTKFLLIVARKFWIKTGKKSWLFEQFFHPG
jgi:hypothetical protein